MNTKNGAIMKKIYEKSEILFSVLWIVAYCVLMSIGDSLSSSLGVEKSVTLPVGTVLSLVLLLFLKNNGLFKRYGLCRPSASARSMLYYLPLLLLLTANLWFGVRSSCGALETALYIGSMLCVGFLEEIIFRGLLFNAMRGDSPRLAVIVSSVTFGIGHIINLFNGSGAELVPNLLQVVYATAAGFMFTMIYLRSESLTVCIVTHGVFNALSVFAVTPVGMTERIVSCIGLTLISVLYALWIALDIRRNGK